LTAPLKRNSPPAPLGALGELLAAAMNPSCAGGDHAAIYLFLTATVIRDRFALRACIVHYGTSEADIGVPVATVREVGARLAA